MKSARYYIAAVSVPVVLGTFAISLCYGIPAGASPPPRIPNCEAKGTIDQTSVGCPTDGSQTLVCNLKLTEAFGDPPKNFDLDKEDCCTCNVPAGEEFTECDPNIEPPTPGACPQGVVVEPTSIVGINSRTCSLTTVLGKRKLFCFGREGPICFLKKKGTLFCKPSKKTDPGIIVVPAP